MFRCQRCGNVTRSREKETKVVIEYRKKIYKQASTKRDTRIITTHGFEIVKEIRICNKCAENTIKSKLVKPDNNNHYIENDPTEYIYDK